MLEGTLSKLNQQYLQPTILKTRHAIECSSTNLDVSLFTQEHSATTSVSLYRALCLKSYKVHTM